MYTLAVDGWAVTFGTARRGLGGAAARPGPPRCTKCNSPSINGQCTNHRIAVYGPLLYGFDVPVKMLTETLYNVSSTLLELSEKKEN